MCRLGAKAGTEIINPAAGTVLDSVITGPSDFYLIGHKAVQVITWFLEK